MDTRIVNELAQRYKDRVLRLTPELFSQLGILKNSINLRLDEFYVTCIPFDISLSGAKLLAILSDREIIFFEKMIGRPQKLALSRHSPYSTKPVNFYIPLRVTTIRKPDANTPYCFIETTFGPPPQELSEMLVSYFFEGEQAEKFFAESKDEDLSAQAIIEVLGSESLSLIKEGCDAERLKILSFSPKRLRVFGEIKGPLPAIGETLELEPFEGEAACLLLGTCVEMKAFTDAPGFYFLGIEQAFSMPVAIRLMKLAKKGMQRKSN